MKLKFLGDLAKLKKCVSRTGIAGQWRDLENGQKQYRTDDGAFLNWWKSSGTVNFQGKEEATIRKLSEPFVRLALRKGLLGGERDADEEIADLPGVISEIAKLKRLQKRMRVDAAELKRRQKRMRIEIAELKEARS